MLSKPTVLEYASGPRIRPLPAAPWLRPAVPYETIIMNPAGG